MFVLLALVFVGVCVLKYVASKNKKIDNLSSSHNNVQITSVSSNDHAVEEQAQDNGFHLKHAYKSITQESVCPNCGCLLNKFPGRSVKCKECGERIFRIKMPNDERIYLLSSTEGLLLKAEIEAYYNNRYKQEKANQMGLTIQEYEKLECNDIESLINNLKNEKKYQSLSSVCRELAFKNYDKQRFRKSLECQKLFFKYSLENDMETTYRDVPISELEVELWTKEYCPIKNGTKMTVEQFRNTIPIPCKARCPSAPIFDCTFCIKLKDE